MADFWHFCNKLPLLQAQSFGVIVQRPHLKLVDWRQSLQPPIVARYIGQLSLYPFKPYVFLIVSDPKALLYGREKYPIML